MPRGSRLALWCLALLLSLSLYYKGRVPSEKGGDAAFLRPGATGVLVRLSGDLPRPGLYRFPDGVPALTAIKMTLPAQALPEGWRGETERRLRPGDVVTITLREGRVGELSFQIMGVKERMLLGIALDPERLNAEEWAALPGIGPVLAARIVEDRHKNGAFLSLDALQRVPGIGPRKLEGIRRYF